MKGKRFEVPAGAVYALAAAIMIISAAVLILALSGNNTDGREEEEAPRELLPHLKIEDVFFRTHESSSISVMMSIYLTNDGLKDARDVEAHIWPIVEESNIATDKVEIVFGNIGVNETGEAEETIELKAGTLHSVDILVFESEKLVLRGRSTVSTEGAGGSDYVNVEVRGTSDDSDYDGMPDSWEEYYGLDPDNPDDASEDPDKDGISNLDEYRLNREPIGGNDETSESNAGSLIHNMIGKEEKNNAAILGSALFLLLVIGLILIIVFVIAAHGRKRRRNGEETFFVKEESSGKVDFPVIVKEGHDEPRHDYEESDLPMGRGIYE